MIVITLLIGLVILANLFIFAYFIVNSHKREDLSLTSGLLKDMDISFDLLEEDDLDLINIP